MCCSVDMGVAFKSTVESLSSDSTLKAVVVSGEGGAFSAGGDMKFLNARANCTDPNLNCAEMLRFYNYFLSVRQLPVPVIAGVCVLCCVVFVSKIG